MTVLFNKKYLFLVIAVVMAGESSAFEFTGQKWPGARTEFYVNIDGSSATNVTWNAAFTGAMGDWSQLTDFNFSVINEYRDPCLDDGLNGVDFTADVCGTEFGANTLAVTVRRLIAQVLGPAHIVEADIVVNQDKDFDIFDGNLVQFGVEFAGLDFRRIALHELGHALGLDHTPPFVAAIMAPNIGNLDHLTDDDIEGVNTLYGGLRNCTVRPLAFGVSNNSLDESDCTVVELTSGSEDTSFIDLYEFSLASVTTVQFSMSGPGLDSVLILADQDFNYLGFDDKSSGACDSALTRILQPGNYFLMANTFDVPPKTECGNTGAYSLDAAFIGVDLLELGANLSLQGGVSTASFRGGVSANDGYSWGNRFIATDSLDIRATVAVDPLHRGQPGFLVVAAVIDGRILLQNELGQFIDADPNAPVLTRARSTILAAQETLDIANDLVPAELGISSITVDFLVGYGLDANPQEVYYHATPINLRIVP